MQRSRDNTARLAKALWSIEALDLQPKEFQSRFDAIYASAEGPATLWQLGGAANDYLRHYPDTIRVPNELAWQLLDSTLVDARIVGLKLLNRCSSDTAAILSAICRALDRNHKNEMYGGLCELDNLLRRLVPTTRLSIDDVLPRLSRLSSSPDPYVRDCASRFSDWVQQFTTGGTLRAAGEDSRHPG